MFTLNYKTHNQTYTYTHKRQSHIHTLTTYTYVSTTFHRYSMIAKEVTFWCCVKRASPTITINISNISSHRICSHVSHIMAFTLSKSPLIHWEGFSTENQEALLASLLRHKENHKFVTASSHSKSLYSCTLLYINSNELDFTHYP